MSNIQHIFEKIEKLSGEDGQNEFLSIFINESSYSERKSSTKNFEMLYSFLSKIFNIIDELAVEIKNDKSILISVKNQKLLRICFQLVTSLGVAPCLIPGLGINLAKRSTYSKIIPLLKFSDEEKYKMLVEGTKFFSRSYEVPILKSIIITLHLSDYLSALIQLSFAPLKKPGIYDSFVMTQDMYDKFTLEKKLYLKQYDHLVTNCFQPILMKELLVLQAVTDPCPPPKFVKQVIAKEMSNRLLVPGGLLSLIRCFIESYNIDIGFEWKKINMICKIISVKHGKDTEDEYLKNICGQISQILSLNNTHYLTTAISCVLSLSEKYFENNEVKNLMDFIFNSFVYETLVNKSHLPGTIILTSQEIDHKVNILHACIHSTNSSWPVQLLIPNLFILFLIGAKCTKNDEMKGKLNDIILKCLERLDKVNITDILKTFLFGNSDEPAMGIIIEEYDAGVTIKHLTTPTKHSKEDNLNYFLALFKIITDINLVQIIFEVSLLLLIDVTVKRQQKANRDLLFIEDEPITLDTVDEQYAVILQLLSEMATLPKVISTLKSNTEPVVQFIEYFLSQSNCKSNDECVTISLVLLNMVLSNTKKNKYIERNQSKLTAMLKIMLTHDNDFNHILIEEALSLINYEVPQKKNSACEKALEYLFDNLLPVRAHGIIELTKLIDSKDPETISKKHYIFCIFQEQLKDSDTYMYLAAINGLASLCTHCTEDVLHVLCKEFLQTSIEDKNIDTKDIQNKIAELKMKIGDVIVKVVKRLGDMAIVHKTILLNTFLCACRDDDPLIRTSALSNLAEIAMVLHYKIGTIIYEVLLCIWSIIETDKSIECRRAAVMVIASLIKGLGKETLVQLKENLLPIYRTLKELYRNPNEDSILRLHAQIALENLNDIVHQFLFPELKMEKQFNVADIHTDIVFK